MEYDVLDYAQLLRQEVEPPCLSLYQPTHRQHPDNQQDLIRFGNLITDLENSLKQKYPNRAIKPLLDPFRKLAADREFWNHAQDGLAVLASANTFKVFRLQRPVAELALVADSFHTKPLMRISQSADRYQILGINRRSITLYEGNRDILDQVDLPPGVPATLEGALGDALVTNERSEGTAYDGSVAGATVRRPQDVHQQAIERDTERFFRTVDRAVLENYSRPNGVPLILAALPEHHNMFRRISQNPYLAAEALPLHPDTLPIGELQKRAWELMLPRYLERLGGLVNAYNDAGTKGLGTSRLDEAARAALDGRIATLLVEADRILPGRIDPDSAKIEHGDADNPEFDDVFDDLGEAVIRAGGEVIIVPKERMPTDTGIAATYRF